MNMKKFLMIILLLCILLSSSGYPTQNVGGHVIEHIQNTISKAVGDAAGVLGQNGVPAHQPIKVTHYGDGEIQTNKDTPSVLLQYGVEVHNTNVHPGPVITDEACICTAASNCEITNTHRCNNGVVTHDGIGDEVCCPEKHIIC